MPAVLRPKLSLDQERAFKQAITERVIPFAGIACLAGAGSFIFLAAWDYSIDPTSLQRTWPVRLSAALCFLVVGGLTLSRRFDRHFGALLVMGFLTATVHAGLVFALVPEGFSLGIPGLLLGLVFLPVLTRSIWEATAALMTTFIASMSVMALTGATTVQVLNAAFWLAGASLFTLLFCLLTDAANRREFILAENLAEERKRSEALLLNVLPQVVADRLKVSSDVIAYHNEDATVVFADLIGFTDLSRELSAYELVDLLNRLFSRFDDLCVQAGLEKIKTIGDAYMAVAGVPVARADHAEAASSFALALLSAIREFRAQTGLPLRLRIGIHSGPLVSGVIGKSKFAFDVWGETVNTASRLESQGLPDTVQLSETTASLLRGAVPVVLRGPVKLRGLGEKVTYLLNEDALELKTR